MNKNTAFTEIKIPEKHAAILEKVQLAFVSTLRHTDGYISTNPVGFIWDGEYLRFSTLKDRVKYQNLQHDPRITVCVLDPDDHTHYIEIRGVAEISEDPDRVFLQQIVDHYQGPAKFDHDAPESERVIVKVIPHEVSSPLLYGGRLAAGLDHLTIPQGASQGH